MDNIESFEGLVGQTLLDVQNSDDEELIFTLYNGDKYKLYHNQACCESVTIEDIIGELSDLIGSPILMAEEVTSDKNPDDIDKSYQDSFFTWTFYKLATIKGYVTIRWCSSSNGYYSESVDWDKCE